MDGEHPEDIAADATDPADRSLADDLRLLAHDARRMAETEIAYQRSRAGIIGGGIGKIAAFGAGALLFVLLALVALVVGLVIALTPLVTAWGATAIVTGSLLLLAAILAFAAKAAWTRITGLVGGEGPLG